MAAMLSGSLLMFSLTIQNLEKLQMQNPSYRMELVDGSIVDISILPDLLPKC
jgi:hypothetical protein